jgi:GH24 family phage-related lysozyme (muramidase)
LADTLTTPVLAVLAQQQTTSAAGVAFIKGWEAWNGTVDKKTGLTYAKDDGFGNGTIGWGHNCGKCADFAGGITRAQGDALLTQDLGRFEGAVNGLGANLSQQQFDGLVAFAFNVRRFQNSTLMGNVASGRPVTEANFTVYGGVVHNHVKTVVPSIYRRRETEWDVYANGHYDSSH